MADSITQRDVEKWIVANELPRLFGEPFEKCKMPLAWGGAFECDAVSKDRQTVMCISTSCCKTASGRSAVGKYHKIKADALYLLHIQARRRVLAFTDLGMRDHFERERTRGRFPPQTLLELILIHLPQALAKRLSVAAVIASDEVSPEAALRRTLARSTKRGPS